MSGQITHRPDPETGHLVQIVSPATLRAILRADGDTFGRPKEFGPHDEWDVGRRRRPSARAGGNTEAEE